MFTVLKEIIHKFLQFFLHYILAIYLNYINSILVSAFIYFKKMIIFWATGES